MAKLNWTPWMSVGELKDTMDRYFNDSLSGMDMPGFREKGKLWVPVADVMETEHAFVYMVELPGIEMDLVRVEVKENDLWVYGERRFEKDIQGGVYQVLERNYGPFARNFALSPKADKNSVKAWFKDGLLTVQVSKTRRNANRRRIPIEFG